MAEWAPGPVAKMAEPDPAAEWKAEAERLREALAVEKAGTPTRARSATQPASCSPRPNPSSRLPRAAGVRHSRMDTARRAKVAL